MNENTLKELKEKLEESKKSIESQLKGFAEKDKNIKGDWDTKYPRTHSGTGGAQLEDAADEVEEYSNLLPVEHSLELQLVDIGSALEKIIIGIYGKCEKCGKEISEERLKAYPEAKTCNECPI